MQDVSPYAGHQLPPQLLVNIPALQNAYFAVRPDPMIPQQRVLFGTSGHRGSSLTRSFNENHILAIVQAICWYREKEKITGPLYIGYDTHALSHPAYVTAVEVLAANDVDIMIPQKEQYTPTPVISHAILAHNTGRPLRYADGIVITPSHNPPDSGGIKYNPPHGGPASSAITNWISRKANQFLEHNLAEVKRVTFARAIRARTTHTHNYIDAYINDLGSVVDMKVISGSGIHIGVDPLGGAGVHYWAPIAEHYNLNLTVVNTTIDKTFRFVPADYDGKIRMDPSSSDAMSNLIGMKDRFDIAFACDTDHDRHGIIAPHAGLMNPNAYLSVAIDYLLQHRDMWPGKSEVGKTVATTQLIDRIAKKHKRTIHEVPVGFKWFAEGLRNASLCFAGEESAGAAFLRMNGSVWTTDKDGFTPALLAAEITARTGRDPGEIYGDLTEQLGTPVYARVEAALPPDQKQKFLLLDASSVKHKELAGEKIRNILTTAPGNGDLIDGIKVIADSGWFVARPSGTEAVYKIYAESFSGNEHLQQIIEEAQHIVNAALK